MDRYKAPRTNRSKKTLPAAFSGRGTGGDGGHSTTSVVSAAAGTAVASSGCSVSNSGTAVAAGGGFVDLGLRRHVTDGLLALKQQRPTSPPPPLNGWARGAGDILPRRRGIRLDTLVFLSSCPQRHGHFAMKKMLHPPTLELFCLLEIPGADHQRAPVRASLQDWLRRWCALQAQHPDLLVAVCEAFWDAPQGYPMGILCEYMPLGSLEELIQACGGLPEEALREVAQAVLQALAALHSASPPVVHGCLKPSQVLFTASGRPRLTPGLAQRLKLCQVWALPAPSGEGKGGAGVHAGAWGPGASPEQLPAVDIFDLGLLLLVCALGGLDVLLDAVPHAREFGSQCTRSSAPLSAVFHNTCALLQHELQGTTGQAAAAEAAGGHAGDMGYLPPAADLLFNRQYSGPFLAFVSTCLEAHTRCAPVSADELLKHQFLREAPVGPLVSLSEMQDLARLLNEAPGHDPAHFGPATASRLTLPGVAPSVAESAQLYLVNIAQSIAPHCGAAGRAPSKAAAAGRGRSSSLEASTRSSGVPSAWPRWREQEWETVLADTARTLGLPRSAVRAALEAQLEHLLMQGPARER